MLFGHQSDVNQSQPEVTDQSTQGYVNPEDQSAQTVAPQDPVVQDTAAPADAGAGVNPLAVDPATGASLPVVQPDQAAPVDEAEEQPSVLDQPIPDQSVADVSVPADPSPAPIDPPIDPGSPFSAAPAAPEASEAPEATPAETLSQMIDTPSLDTPEPGATPDFNYDHHEAGAVVPATAPESEPEPASAPAEPVSFTPPVDNPEPSEPSADSANTALLDLKQQAISQLSPLISHLEQSPEEKFRTTMMLIQSTDNPGLLHDAYNAAQAIPDEKARAQALLDVVNEINYFTQQQDSLASQKA